MKRVCIEYATETAHVRQLFLGITWPCINYTNPHWPCEDSYSWCLVTWFRELYQSQSKTVFSCVRQTRRIVYFFRCCCWSWLCLFVVVVVLFVIAVIRSNCCSVGTILRSDLFQTDQFSHCYFSQSSHITKPHPPRPPVSLPPSN